MLSPLPLLDWKAVFRRRAADARRNARRNQPDAARFAAMHFINTFVDGAARPAIGLYHPDGEELDTTPLAEALMQAGHAIYLPAVIAPKQPLVFRLHRVDVPLVAGRFGIMTPPDDAPVGVPDVLVVPLLAVRPDGARLGRGGGYYDRTLNALRAGGTLTAIGYGYAAQAFDRFPVDAHDAFLDGFVSEQGATRFARRR